MYAKKIQIMYWFFFSEGKTYINERKQGDAKLTVEDIDDLAAQEEIRRAYSVLCELKQKFNVREASQQASVLLDALEKRPRYA